MKDRIIDDKVFNPIYHYDQRVLTLRRAVAFWYKKAEEECNRMKLRCKDMRHMIVKQIEGMREAMNSDI